ncbi:MAG: glucosaminidase domain-containing protein [Prolixibacteraceae bacterium]|nr:glucosaminidase domain-containing protein [Prolixibacteraceae bacterium]
MIILSSCNEPDVPIDIRIKTIKLDSISQIIPVSDSIVIPVLYDTLLIDNLASISEKKQQFINQILPAILIAKFKIQMDYQRVDKILKKIDLGDSVYHGESKLIDSLMLKYNANKPDELLIHLKEQPTSLVLAQAAIESGWGQSRFAIEGYNLFGIVSSRSDQNSLKAGNYHPNGKRIFMKRYDNIYESVDHYLLTIGKNKAYKKFRAKRFEEASVYQLVNELNKYSTTGDEYKKMLKQVIIWNDLDKYDKYNIEDSYIYKKGSICYIFKKLCEGEIPYYIKDYWNERI